MSYYGLAASMWEIRVTRSYAGAAYQRLARLPCAAVREYLQSAGTSYPEIIVGYSVSSLWSCASERIAALEAAIRR
jgi:hypothetical protein